ncbi:MAG: hypothetical protein JWO83_620 [Caulobacteraceae bacterium]|nr:hypothetical protein [Caulobacteraceae bacterium]
MDDPHDLQRFVTAQAPVYDHVRGELRRGRKASHWMWFVFPQIRGLGHSAMAERYAIASLDEARAYLEHPVLGPRLRESAALVNAVEGRSLNAILGSPDDLKFHSSMTLFALASGNEPVFVQALDKYFAGEPDPATVASLPPPGGSTGEAGDGG